MEITVLKNNIHHLVDQIQSQQLLEEYYHEMKSVLQRTKKSSWDTLTEIQKKEVLLSYMESEVEENLLDHETVMGKYRK